MRLLLDTCTFLWIAANAPDLSADARRLFSDPTNSVYLSSVSAWEICVKHGLGKLPLPDLPEVFLPAQRGAHGILPLELDEASVLYLPRLNMIHKDPFDRMLVCQALANGLSLLTPDPLIRAYPVTTLW